MSRADFHGQLAHAKKKKKKKEGKGREVCGASMAIEITDPGRIAASRMTLLSSEGKKRREKGEGIRACRPESG